MLLALLAVVLGLVLLTKAADEFVEGAIRLAAVLRVSPVVIGAVIVGFGTSAPEMLVSALAAADGELDIAVGNIVGSNIANLTLVLGLAAAIAAITVDSSVLRREAPLAAGATVLFAVLILVGGLTRLDGVLLLLGLAGAVTWITVGSKRAGNAELADELADELSPETPHKVPVEALRTAAGLIGTVVGARLLVDGAVHIAEEVGLSQAFIGLTLVAVGTSLPELVTAVSAARKGAHDLIVGNVLGSNLFNSLAVGGTAAVVGPGPLADREVAVRAVLVMLVTTAAALATLVVGRRIERRDGVVLVGLYAITLPLLAA